MNLRKKMILILTTLFLLNLTNLTIVNAAIESIAIDEDEYNLYIDEFPDAVYESIYAKFNSSKSNSDDYYLTMPTDDDSDKILTDALNNSGINTDGKEIASMNILLYREGEDDDVLVKDATTILLPLPDDAQETPDNISFYIVSGDKVNDINYSLVSVDDIYYVKFSTSNYTTYGFLYDTLSEDDEEELDLNPTSVPESTPEPTRPPEAAPTTAVPPTKTPANSEPPSQLANRDDVPKTGDDFSPFRLIALSAMLISILGLVVYECKK